MGYLCTQWMALQEKNSKVREIESFTIGGWDACLLLWRETSSLFSMPVSYTNIHEDRLKQAKASLDQPVGNHSQKSEWASARPAGLPHWPPADPRNVSNKFCVSLKFFVTQH